MLKSFAQHLKEKGWFEITHIAMDERLMKDMQETLKVIRKADKDFKVSLAGTYHPELVDELDDYCLRIAERFPPETIDSRREARKSNHLLYLLFEPRPNTFTFSPACQKPNGWHGIALKKIWMVICVGH